MEGKRCNSNFCNNYLFINYSIHVWLKSVRSLTQIRIKKIYHQHARGLVGMFFKRQSVYLWVQPVLLFSPTCSCIRMRQTSYIGLLKKNEKKLARIFNLTLRYIYDILSLNNSRFGDFVDCIYPIEPEIKDTTDADRSVSYLDLHLEIDSEGRLRTKLYDKRDDFNFPIVNFPFVCSNILSAPAYGVYISHLIDIPELVAPIRISLIEGSC